MGTDFSNLANEINLLGEDIEEKCEMVCNKAESLSSLLKSSLSTVLNLKASQKEHLHIIIDNTTRNFAALTKKLNLSSVTTANISKSYQKISRKISDIVMSLQFHDITRQQIEHVESALYNVLALFQEKSHKNGHKRQSIILAEHICKIQEGQLVIARDKLTYAVGSIIGNLKSIARDIMAISQQVQELGRDASQEGSSFLVEMEESLAAVAMDLNLYGVAKQDLSRLIQAVAPSIGDMANFLRDIEKIEIAIERIALNACIKAAHLGEKGATLGVLAEATQNLVGETSQQTQAISEHLKSINAAAQQLSAGEGAGEGEAEVDVASLVADIGMVLKTLGSLNENVISKLTQVDHEGKSLSADLTKASKEITVHEYAREALNQVIAGISDLERQLQVHISDKKKLTQLDEEKLDNLKAQYTMGDERKVHNQILISSPTPIVEELLVEVHDVGETNVENTKDDDANLGDNVELF